MSFLRRRKSTSSAPPIQEPLPGAGVSTMPAGTRKPKRSWKARLGEFAIWSAVAIGTALILISMSERLLPTNF